MVRDLGHARWKQENNGWNDLTQNWSLKHGFLHACRHRPHAAAAQHQSPQPLPNAATAATSSTIPESTRNPECQNDLIGWPPPPEMVELIPNLGLAGRRPDPDARLHFVRRLYAVSLQVGATLSSHGCRGGPTTTHVGLKTAAPHSRSRLPGAATSDHLKNGVSPARWVVGLLFSLPGSAAVRPGLSGGL